MILRKTLLLLPLLTGLSGCGEDAPPPPPPIVAPKDAGRERAPSPEVDAGAPALDAAGDGLGDGLGDGSSDAAAGEVAPLPTELAITALAPASAARGTALGLEVQGIDFGEMATILFDGQPLPTTRQSSSRLSANLTAAHTEQAGFHAVSVTSGAEGRTTAVVYFHVPPGASWPEVVDVNPDSAQVGEKVRIVGFNITGEALRIADPSGQMAPSGRIGTIAGSNQLLETAEFTVPAGWKSGPLVISTAVGTFRAKIFNVGRNLATLPGTKLSASSEYGEGWTIAGGADNDIFTSWFTAEGDCVSRGPMVCMKSPWFLVTFAEPQTVGRIALRGSREYTSGYDFLQARFEILGANETVLWSSSRVLPEPDRDLDIVLPMPVSGAAAVRFRSEKDQSADPGFAELEIFGP